MAEQTTTPNQPQDLTHNNIVEVWGDTVDLAALIKAMLIGAVLSLIFFYGSKSILTGLVSSANLTNAYSMLCGLIGCLIAGIICAKLFKPKRLILESDENSMALVEALLDQWEKEGKSIGDTHNLPEKIVSELKELNLYEVFLKRSQNKS